MKSQIKLAKEDLDDFREFLVANDYQVNTERVDWRVLMYRKKKKGEWTQAYDGLTQGLKDPRVFLRVFGNDQNAVDKFYRERMK